MLKIKYSSVKGWGLSSDIIVDQLWHDDVVVNSINSEFLLESISITFDFIWKVLLSNIEVLLLFYFFTGKHFS